MVERYQLADAVSFCVIDGRAVFLDVRRDRYFQLGARLQPVFQSLLNAEPVCDRQAQRLVRSGLIRRACGDAPLMRPASIQPPSRSLLEDGRPSGPIGVRLMFEVSAAMAGAKVRLKTRPLSANLDRIRARKTARETSAKIADPNVLPDNIARLAMAFNRGRRRIPIDGLCLLNSLALVEFLAAHNVFPDLVLGVSPAPFSAHCWVEWAGVVLNDAVDRATTHTPILVI